MAASTDPRMLENKVLLKAAAKMEDLVKRLKAGEKPRVAEIGEIMEFNQKLWILFTDDACNDAHPLPQDLKNNIANLALFVFKRTRDVLIDPTPANIQVLIDINRNIAAGLAKRPPVPQGQKTTAKTPGAEKAAETTDSSV